jgi:hypothetical protein
MSISTTEHKTGPERFFELKVKNVARTRRATSSANTVAGWKTRLTKTTVNELQLVQSVFRSRLEPGSTRI